MCVCSACLRSVHVHVKCDRVHAQVTYSAYTDHMLRLCRPYTDPNPQYQANTLHRPYTITATRGRAHRGRVEDKRAAVEVLARVSK